MNKDKGFIGVSRCIVNHWIYQDAEYFKVWFEMLYRARYSFEPETKFIENHLVTINRGEFIFGRKSWSERLGVGEQRLRTLIRRLTQDNMIELVQKYNKFTIYKIINYEKYNQQGNQQGMSENQYIEGCSNHQINHQLTTNQPPTNHQLTTQEQRSNKENKVNKDIYIDIYEFWNSKGIIQHRKLTGKMQSKINSTLRDYNPDTLKEIISTYAEIVLSEKYWFTHKWTLEEFLQRGMSKFENREVATQNYLKDEYKKVGGANREHNGGTGTENQGSKGKVDLSHIGFKGTGEIDDSDLI